MLRFQLLGTVKLHVPLLTVAEPLFAPMVTVTSSPLVVPLSVGVAVPRVAPALGDVTATVGMSMLKLRVALALPPNEFVAVAVAV